jgi:uncharacterized protein (TIGR00375 family)
MFVDLHIHSKYSRATSKNMDVDNLVHFGKIKGLNVIGTGDFTHPKYLKELKEKLEKDENIYKFGDMYFVLTTEVNNQYYDAGKYRRVHNVIMAPDFDTVDQVNEYLSKFGDLSLDGRPTLKLPCSEMVYELKHISDDIEIIPAHIWTPWFGVLGSKSGYDSIEDCFKDQTKNISALETGLSSDPPMNFMVSKLDKFILVSNSDAHSPYPWRLGREANCINVKPDYFEILKAIRTGNNFEFTIEVDPAYGKYHFDGNRETGVVIDPLENQSFKDYGKMTIGVLHRVKDLGDREYGFVLKNKPKYVHILPFGELLKHIKKLNFNTKGFWKEYNAWVEKFGNEFNLLLYAPIDEIKKYDKEIAYWIKKNREGKIKVKPGYDGVYGEPIFDRQMTLF